MDQDFAVFEKALKVSNNILLGSGSHGMYAVEMIIYLYEHYGTRMPRPGTIFIESFRYGGMKNTIEKTALFTSDLRNVLKLEHFGFLVVGLEDDLTATPRGTSLSDTDEFLKSRCKASNKIWAQRILSLSKISHINFTCCGAAHLVPFYEHGELIKPVSYHMLNPNDYEISVLSLYLSDTDTVGSLYRPEGGLDVGGLPVVRLINEDYEEDLEEE
jgi:hypothetical protein